MKLESLELVNFKNYLSAQLSFDGKFICFTGKNGQGKTNMLDAIYYLSLTKSFLNPVDMANIKHEEPFFRIAGNYVLDDKSLHSVVCLQERNQRKKIIVNDKVCERFADHIGEFPLVIISPADFELFSTSEERRKFIDNTISQFDKTYLDNLLQYNRILAQRNRLLKNITDQKDDVTLLDPYDFQLEQYAHPIHQMRKEFLTGFLPLFNSYYQDIARTNESVETVYETELENYSLGELLKKFRSRDIAMGHTTCGIHREDFTFKINGFHAKKFGSQGQQKSFLIALKLAKHKYIGIRRNTIPLLLIDDLHDKLDAFRVGHLFDLLNNGGFDQIFITDTQKERLDPLMHEIRQNSSFFNIDQGTANQILP